jgi:phosphate/sulfate permease
MIQLNPEFALTTKKQKIRPEFIAFVIVAIIIGYALTANWWKTHAVIGLSIIGVLIIAFVFALYKYPSFRLLFAQKVKQTSKKIVYEDIASDREPIPNDIRTQVYKRSNHRCENPDCRHTFIHIHHVDMNNSNNKLINLIALCPNCHQQAHDGKFTTTQLRNWLMTDYHRMISIGN